MTTSAPYYGDSAVMRTPPPDLPSLLLKERIVYLGLRCSRMTTPSVRWALMSRN